MHLKGAGGGLNGFPEDPLKKRLGGLELEMGLEAKRCGWNQVFQELQMTHYGE
jgi:hypothetical protein